jgi:hypothetical protein
MRLFAVVSLAAILLCLACAAYLPAPWWMLALYLVPLAATLFACGLAAALLEALLGPHFRAAAPVPAAALALFSVLYAVFERAPGALGPGLPMQQLGDNALSVAALGAAIGGAVLAAQGLRAPQTAAQSLAGCALAGCAWALGATARAIGLPFLSPWALALLAAALVFFLLAHRRQPGEVAARIEEEVEETGPEPSNGP